MNTNVRSKREGILIRFIARLRPLGEFKARAAILASESTRLDTRHVRHVHVTKISIPA